MERDCEIVLFKHRTIIGFESLPEQRSMWMWR